MPNGGSREGHVAPWNIAPTHSGNLETQVLILNVSVCAQGKGVQPQPFQSVGEISLNLSKHDLGCVPYYCYVIWLCSSEPSEFSSHHYFAWLSFIHFYMLVCLEERGWKFTARVDQSVFLELELNYPPVEALLCFTIIAD